MHGGSVCVLNQAQIFSRGKLFLLELRLCLLNVFSAETRDLRKRSVLRACVARVCRVECVLHDEERSAEVSGFFSKFCRDYLFDFSRRRGLYFLWIILRKFKEFLNSSFSSSVHVCAIP